MSWNIMLAALGCVFVAAAIISLLGYTETKKTGVLQGYLLAGGGLTRIPVVNLLLSSSFGLNTMLYQGYLGATVGYWGLVVQGAWAASFFFLQPYAGSIRQSRGLHHFLGEAFGMPTRVVAAVCSLIGITVFLGWEMDIGRDALRGILTDNQSVPTAFVPQAAEWLVVGIVVGCLLYTLLGGLRGNATANILQNLLKFLSFGWVTYLLARIFVADPNASFWSAFAPRVSIMHATIGLWGLFTSLAFGVVWQFVDMSMWQSIAASSKSTDDDIKWNLRWSGVLVFITPGILGTLFGVFLSNVAGSDANVLVTAARVIGDAHPLVQFFFAAAMISAMMSLIDGLLLASTYALVVDILHRKHTLEELDADEDKASNILVVARLLLVGLAAAGIWGIPQLIAMLDRPIFFFSFVVVVAQLSLFGPIIVGLRLRGNRDHASRPSSAMWLPMIVSASVGFTTAIYGATREIKWLTDGAGTFTLVASALLAFWIARSSTANMTEGRPKA